MVPLAWLCWYGWLSGMFLFVAEIKKHNWFSQLCVIFYARFVSQNSQGEEAARFVSQNSLKEGNSFCVAKLVVLWGKTFLKKSFFPMPLYKKLFILQRFTRALPPQILQTCSSSAGCA